MFSSVSEGKYKIPLYRLQTGEGNLRTVVSEAARCKPDRTGTGGGPRAELKREGQRLRQQHQENPDQRELQMRRSAAEDLYCRFPEQEKSGEYGPGAAVLRVGQPRVLVL